MPHFCELTDKQVFEMISEAHSEALREMKEAVLSDGELSFKEFDDAIMTFGAGLPEGLPFNVNTELKLYQKSTGEVIVLDPAAKIKSFEQNAPKEVEALRILPPIRNKRCGIAL